MKEKWATIPLGEISVVRGGSTNPAKFKQETFELYSIPAYDTGKPEVLQGEDIGSTKKNVLPNDVLISRIVPHIQRVWIVGAKGKNKQIASGEWIIYRSDKFYPPFLRYALLSKQFHAKFMQTISGVGGSLLRARPDQVAKIEISLPPLAEQKRIAAILDKADAIRRKRQAAIKLADDFLRATFLNMFGDPVTNPKGWAVMPFKSIINSIDGGWSAKGLDRPAKSDERGVLKISAVTTGLFKPTENKAVHDIPAAKKDKLVTPDIGDLLFSRANTRELVAATCIVTHKEPNLFLPDKLWRIVPNKDKSCVEFLNFLLGHDGFRKKLTKQATGTSGSMLNISKEKLKSFSIPLPPLKIQCDFSKIFWKVNNLRKDNDKLSQENGDIFNSLTQRAFRGEL